ncbi:MAG: hypothetical protein JWO75_3303 [Actinomycetia bacterium]|jgi:hypothetical protein|nr:hypothetical protein [Actinomycetes bacterium]
MSGMATVPEVPEVPGSRDPRGTRLTAAWVVAVLAGSAVLGLLGGLIWGEFAPRAMLQEVGTGTAQVINAETRAFFGADVWFCAIAVVAGLLTGVLGYRFAVAHREGAARAAVAAALILGALAGEFVMLWLGEQMGLSAYNHELASSANGTLFSGSLALGSKTALTFWPLFTAIVLLVAEWGTRPASGPRPG